MTSQEQPTPVSGAVDLLDNSRKIYVSFGDAPRLVSEPYVLEQLAPLGMSKQGVRRLLRALKVPVIYMGPHRLLDLNTLQLALSAVTRLGQMNFWACGADERAGNGGRPVSITELDIEKFRREWKDVYRHFIVSKLCSGPYRPADLAQLATGAANRLIELGFPQTLRLKTEELQNEAFNAALKEHPELHAPPPPQPLP